MDRTTLEQLYHQYGGLVFRRARMITGNEMDAEDLVQEVFRILVERPDVMADPNAAVSWFYQTTTRRALNLLRSRERRDRREEHAGEAVMSTYGHNPEALRLLREILTDVPELQAQAATYFYMEQMTLDEIAQVMSVSRRSVANYLKRFREHARARTASP